MLAAVDEAEQLGIRKLMTLTYEQAFFERCGFGVVDRQTLPLKVWSECVRCPKNQRCDEIAMTLDLEPIEAAIHRMRVGVVTDLEDLDRGW